MPKYDLDALWLGRPDLSSERAPEDDKDGKRQGRLKYGHESCKGLDTKTN
jgi:hypothetical protein